MKDLYEKKRQALLDQLNVDARPFRSDLRQRVRKCASSIIIGSISIFGIALFTYILRDFIKVPEDTTVFPPILVFYIIINCFLIGCSFEIYRMLSVLLSKSDLIRWFDYFMNGHDELNMLAPYCFFNNTEERLVFEAVMANEIFQPVLRRWMSSHQGIGRYEIRQLMRVCSRLNNLDQRYHQPLTVETKRAQSITDTAWHHFELEAKSWKQQQILQQSTVATSSKIAIRRI